MVAHGSTRWRLLMLNCAHLISSHADAPIHNPAGIARRNRADWNITFLQHGVIKDDLSRWLNPKLIDLFVTSTPQEQSSIVGDGTTYAYTTRESRMTGLPRFDRLLELGSHVPVEQRRWILVAPTWRHWLVVPEVDSQRSAIDDSFFDSEYAQEWTALLGDSRLAELADQHGLKIGFLPHPNIQPALARMDLPKHVQALTFTDDVQQVLADTALMVTDYSSMFFNAAYLDRPVVYFQFDAKQVLQGAHTGRPGYFEYERDGFGPVTGTVLDTVSAIEGAVLNDAKVPSAEYQRRIREAFPQRDGRCCERTAAAIEELSPKKVPPDRMDQIVRKIRANPRVQRIVRSQRGRAMVPKLKARAKASPAGRLLK
jgi:CDP-glycerol glycerophosphotransferase (TagB/SpsB family)